MNYKLSKFIVLVLGSALSVTTLFGASELDKVMKDRGLTQTDLLATA